MHKSLYRKWRPAGFFDVCGQEHITTVLKNQIKNRTFSHAYLFCGSRGTGKTTCAKILARAVNCAAPRDGSPCGECESCRASGSAGATDILELDAASNNGVDNIRDIRDEAAYTPSLLNYRVYIIDEAHMLSGSAFNALLKTLEEPPPHVIFILATTELHKLPATIISRCQRFDFRPFIISDIAGRLHQIAQGEGIALKDDAAVLIARYSRGGMRDAITLLEVASAGNAGGCDPVEINGNGAETGGGTAGRAVDAAAVREAAGGADPALYSRTVLAVADGKTAEIFRIIDEVENSPQDITVFFGELIGFFRAMLVTLGTDDPRPYLDVTGEEFELISAVSNRFTPECLLRQIKLLEDAYVQMYRAGPLRRSRAEIALLRICSRTFDAPSDPAEAYEVLLMRISELERRVAELSGGVITAGVTNRCVRADNVNESANSNIDNNIESAQGYTVESNENASGGADDGEQIVNYNAVESSSPAAIETESDAVAAEKSENQSKQSSDEAEKEPRNWSRAKSEIEKTPQLRVFISDARASYTDDGKIKIIFSSKFHHEMAERIGGGAIIKAIAEAESRTLTAADVLFSHSTPQTQNEPIGDFFESE